MRGCQGFEVAASGEKFLLGHLLIMHGGIVNECGQIVAALHVSSAEYDHILVRMVVRISYSISSWMNSKPGSPNER
jgi:hypothetical protein